MKKIIITVLMALISLNAMFVGASTNSTSTDAKIKTSDVHTLGFIGVETFSSGGSISGLPNNEYVGWLHDLDITTDGGTKSFYITAPLWFSYINYQLEDIHIQMDHFAGFTVSNSSGGSIVGIGYNIVWN